MALCPRCRYLVEAQAIRCGHCGLILKAYGHPGIPLHRATGDTSLCLTCAYHADDSCTFPQRPLAQTCTIYQSVAAQGSVAPRQSPPSPWGFKQVWPWLGLLGVSVLIVWVVR
ncbi:MAG: zinc ribbon domain-containing protein [Cyanobacteria bacterium]|nr:zinc ribbon domain-containing protein [Cyanobacteriota bacterium]MDA0865054.1 zinc ribbon domain-containing protein [Cyanobacteriota bacterium]